LAEFWLLFLPGAYLLGGIPSGYLIVRLAGGGDIRSQGSGNIGAANVLRSRGWLVGLLTLLADMTKGALPVLLGRYLFASDALALAGGVAAVIGHIAPLFLKFRGGKGVAPLIGMLLVFQPVAVAVFAVVFVAVTALSRFVSLGSLAGTAAAVLILAFSHPPEVTLPVWGIALLILLRHHANIARLLAGTENRLVLGRKHG
jgi:acyl phosphate:glycerol-3-phosphate acyltransferase